MLRKWLLLFCLFISCALKAESILVVESYDASYAWDISYKKGLIEVLGERFDFHFFEMDTKRIPKEQFQSKADEAWQLYLNLKPTLVVLADDNALEWLAPRFLQTDTPVVYLGINNNPREYGVTEAANFSGVLERPLLKRSVLMLNKFMAVKKVLVLFDDSKTSEVIVDDIFYGKSRVTVGGIVLDIKRAQDFREWQELVLTAKAKQYDALVSGLYHTLHDENGEHCAGEMVIQWTSDNTQIPSFGFWDFSIGKNKNVGGYVVSGYKEGKQAGRIALAMLEGKNVRVRTQSDAQGEFVFSRSQLRKWGLTLPPYIRQTAKFVE